LNGAPGGPLACRAGRHGCVQPAGREEALGRHLDQLVYLASVLFERSDQVAEGDRRKRETQRGHAQAGCQCHCQLDVEQSGQVRQQPQARRLLAVQLEREVVERDRARTGHRRPEPLDDRMGLEDFVDAERL
jgi:hypothetical protein